MEIVRSYISDEQFSDVFKCFADAEGPGGPLGDFKVSLISYRETMQATLQSV